MNTMRVVTAAVAATIADFVYGFVVYGNLMTASFAAQAGIYRSADAQMANMPIGALGILLAMIAAALMFARSGSHGVAAGLRFGALLATFAVGAFVAVNFATINMTSAHSVRMAMAAAAEWLLAGAVIGAIYRR